MQNYLDLLKKIKEEGIVKEDRTGTGTTSIFRADMRFDLSEGFPLVTTKYVNFNAILHELLWFIKGDTNTKYLTDNGVNIWNDWADENGDLGPVYGHQWRSWQGITLVNGEPTDADKERYDLICRVPTQSHDNLHLLGRSIDQLAEVIEGIKTNPQGRRHIVSAWNPADLPDMALPPCHMMFQFYVRGNKLDLCLYQRSADFGIGVCYNVASYSLLLMMVAQVTGYEAGEFIWSGGDVHIYNNLHEQVDTQLTRMPYVLPKVVINPDVKNIDDFVFDDFVLLDYQHHPAIRMPVAV